MFAAADQIMGWSGWWGSLQSLCERRVSRGLQGGYSGLGGGRRGGVGSYDLKEPFLWSVCQRAPQQTQSQVSLVLLAELMRACTLRAGALMFWVAGSLCFLSRSPSLAVPHQKWKGSWEADVLRHVFIQSTLYSPPSSYPICPLLVHLCCMYKQGSISLSLYPTKYTKSPYFIHIIMVSIKVGNFYLSLLPLSACLSLISA